jgi:hypothetical protein
MKNAVHGSRVVGAARIAGPQRRSVNRLIMPASVLAATRGKDREQHAETAGDLSGGPVGPANTIRKPRRYQRTSSAVCFVCFTYTRCESPIGMRENAKSRPEGLWRL